VVRGRRRLPLGPEEPLEPPLAELLEGGRRTLGRGCQRPLQLSKRDRLLLLVPRDRVGLAGELALELLTAPQEAESLVVERRRRLRVEVAELLAVSVFR
jgi:hypothetical protein